MFAHPSAGVLLVPDPYDARLEHCVDRMLTATHAVTSAPVAVAGPEAGAAMSALWRRGFERVEAARRVTCHCADEVSDVLMVLGCKTSDQATAVCEAVMPILREGGTLAIDAGRFRDLNERARLCQMLAHRGLRYRDGAHLRTEIIARKPEAQELFSVTIGA